MTQVTREELGAKLEAVDARNRSMYVLLDQKLDHVAELTRLTLDEAKEAKLAAGRTKWNLLFAVIATIGVGIAVFAIWSQAVHMVSGLLTGGTP